MPKIIEDTILEELVSHEKFNKWAGQISENYWGEESVTEYYKRINIDALKQQQELTRQASFLIPYLKIDEEILGYSASLKKFLKGKIKSIDLDRNTISLFSEHYYNNNGVFYTEVFRLPE